MMAELFQTIAVDLVLAELNPIERWEAARRLDSNIMTNGWFVLTGVFAIVLLTTCFFLVTYRRKLKENRRNEKFFLDTCDRYGLDLDEVRLLRWIVHKAGLREASSIFTMERAFNNGAAAVVDQTLSKKGGRQSEELANSISLLREKLGFRERMSFKNKAEKIESSRQIPVGKEVRITRRMNPERKSADLECEVIANEEAALAVQLPYPVEATSGDLWRVYYNRGANVWEFDSPLIEIKDGVLTLGHSEDVRFVNRRRFLRVPVNKEAYVARFPFKNHFKFSFQGEEIENARHSDWDRWALPEFVPAKITELAGPGLKIESDLDVSVGDRLLVLFRVQRHEEEVAGKSNEQLISVSSTVMQSTAQVRHLETYGHRKSMAVEMFGLPNVAINQLIKATNAAARAQQEQNRSQENSSKRVEIPGV